jgi:NAD(P)-dependent dehydrogenase (short-subunit alcohol dehydrogenase family)
MKSVVVSGVSTGIGWGCVKILIAAGFRVFGSVRKPSDADRLAKEFGGNFTPLIFDVTDEAAVAVGARQVEAALGGETLAGLVNNAGVAVRDRSSTSRLAISNGSSKSISLAP